MVRLVVWWSAGCPSPNRCSSCNEMGKSRGMCQWERDWLIICRRKCRYHGQVPLHGLHNLYIGKLCVYFIGEKTIWVTPPRVTQ